jgi:hypothetical protein
MNDHESIRNEENSYHDIPLVRKVSDEEIRENYFRIKQDVKDIIEEKLNRAA